VVCIPAGPVGGRTLHGGFQDHDGKLPALLGLTNYHDLCSTTLA